MDFLTESSGLHHILEEIFVNLDQHQSLLECENVSIIWKKLLNNPNIWRRKKLEFFDFFKKIQPLPRFVATKILEKKSQGRQIKFVQMNKQHQNGSLFGVSLALAPSSLICSCGNEDFKKGIYVTTSWMSRGVPVTAQPLIRAQSFTSLMADLHQDINSVSSISRCFE